jgi:hypothetical protein
LDLLFFVGHRKKLRIRALIGAELFSSLRRLECVCVVCVWGGLLLLGCN